MELCQSNDNMLSLIRDWKVGLSEIIFKKVMENVGIEGKNEKISPVLNYGGKLLSKITEVFKSKINDNIDTTTIHKDVISQYISKNFLYVYIDDLDRGWNGAEIGVRRISALLNAARDLTNDNPGLCIRISLRSDVYF